MAKVLSICPECKKEIWDYRNRTYCGRECLALAYEKRPHTWGDKISKSKTGHGWPEGYHERQSGAQKKRFVWDTPWNKGKYKTGVIGYTALHRWVYSKLGSPRKCATCGTETANKYQWANISGEYKQDVTDWIRLCPKCHMYRDGTVYNLSGMSHYKPADDEL